MKHLIHLHYFHRFLHQHITQKSIINKLFNLRFIHVDIRWEIMILKFRYFNQNCKEKKVEKPTGSTDRDFFRL